MVDDKDALVDFSGLIRINNFIVIYFYQQTTHIKNPMKATAFHVFVFLVMLSFSHHSKLVTCAYKSCKDYS